METDHILVRLRDAFLHTLPHSVEDMTDQPLYIAVAIWGLHSEQPGNIRCRALKILRVENVTHNYRS